MSRRRRGADFSQLLESFCNSTDCRPDLDKAVQDRLSATKSENAIERTYMQDRRITTKSSNDEDNSGTCSFKSTILAGHAATSESQESSENSYQTAHSGSTAGHPTSADISIDSCRSEAPSLMNRAINIQFVPQPDLDLSQSTAEPRTSEELNRNIETSEPRTSEELNRNIETCEPRMSKELNRNIETSEKSSPDRRDTNYNIKNNPAAKASTSFMSESHGRGKSTKKVSSTSQDDDSEAKILRRLSQEFIDSPRKFTERLVTIIDESENGCENAEISGVNLSRMTKEFRKMCKFIQDESMPEWAPSLYGNSILGTSKYPEDFNKLANTQIPETIEESPTEVSSTSDFKTPDKCDNNVGRKIYRKTPLNIFKKNCQEIRDVGSPGSPNSTRNFVYLEKYLNEQPCSPRNQEIQLNRRSSTSDVEEQLRDKMMIVLKSEQQLASLDDTNSPEFETFDSHQAHGAQEREKTPPVSPNVHKKRYEVNEIVDPSHAVYEGMNEDELSMSLRIELEKQRERCFETARQMQKIEEDAKNSNEDYPKVLERYGIDPEAECIKTIKSCLMYQNCWMRIRQNDHLKKNEASSLDSGIDTRSISRTLYGSSKKSSNIEKSAGSSKKSRNYETLIKTPRSEGISALRSTNQRSATPVPKKIERKTVSTNLCQRTPRKIVSNPRKRSPINLCPVTKSLNRSRSRSRSRSGEIISPSRYVASKVRTFRTLERGKINENRMISKAPEMVDGYAEHSPEDSMSQGANYEKRNEHCRKTPQTTPRREKSPKYILSSPKASPSVRNPSKERVPKMTNYRMESPSSHKVPKSPRGRFFVTPGKNVPLNATKVGAKTFFPSMDADIQEEKSPRIVKSLHAPGIYRLGYNNAVVSPVSMYIRGTDMNLIQNVQPRKNEMLLTPSKATATEEKLKFKLSAKNLAPRDSPRKHRIIDHEKDSDSQSDDNDENKHGYDFALPKATYELPAQIHTVNQSPKSFGGARTRGLLQSMQNRVVIRHEGKRFGKYEDVPDSGSDSVDMSIHVQRSAEKTNFMNRRK